MAWTLSDEDFEGLSSKEAVEKIMNHIFPDSEDETWKGIYNKGMEEKNNLGKRDLENLISVIRDNPFLSMYIANKVIALGVEKK